MYLKDRAHAGTLLGHMLELKCRNRDVIVYALPRGGVPVGVEVAQACGASLDLVITRKIASPHNPEYARCAVSEDGDVLCTEDGERCRQEPWFTEAL